MELTMTVKKKGFAGKDGKTVEYYEYIVNVGGEFVKLKLDKDKNDLFKYFVDKMNLPLEQDEKDELIKRMLNGEKLSAAEKARLSEILNAGGEE